MEYCIGNLVAGAAMKLVHAQNENVANSWLASVGSGNSAIYMDGGSMLTVTNCLNCTGVGGASVYLANSPQTIRFFSNTIDAGVGASVFDIPSGSQPLDLQYGLNKSYNLPIVPVGAETRLALAQNTFGNWISPMWVTSYASGSPASAFSIYDPVNKKHKFLRNSNSTLQIVDDAHANVLWTMDDGGNVQQTGAITLRSLPWGSLPVSPNGTLFYCSDCTKTTPCTITGTGAIAKRLNGAWDCN